MEQNSEEWQEWRRQGIGASDSPIIMGISPWSTPYELWCEKMGSTLLYKQQDNDYIKLKGHAQEPRARALYEIETGHSASAKLAIHHKYGWLRASLDGWREDVKRVVEIKLVGKDKHDQAMRGEIPPVYYPQIQHQLFVTGAESVDYVSFFEESIEVVNVKPDLDYIGKWFLKVQEFWDHVTTKSPPALCERDFFPVDDNTLKMALGKYVNLDIQKKELEENIKKVRKEIFARKKYKKVFHKNIFVTQRTIKVYDESN